MLSGHFENCYGIKELDLGTGIDFNESNKAIIYAPNGVMKTSFTRVFEDISKGEPSKDKIFPSAVTAYSIHYYDSIYGFSSESPCQLSPCNEIYVINSFEENFEFTKETVGTLLADESTRDEYNVLMTHFSSYIKRLESELSAKSSLTKPKIKDTLIADFELSQTADWTDIINAIHNYIHIEKPIDYLNEIRYAELFNDKAMKIYERPEFRQHIQMYIERLNDLLHDSELLNDQFTDRSAEALSKSFTTNDIFAVHHKVILRGGTEISSLEDWKNVVSSQINRMYGDSELKSAFEELKRLLTANNEVDAARRIIIQHQQIIPQLFEIPKTKKRFWASYCSSMETPFDELYNEITKFTESVRVLYERAGNQSERWEQVVSEFNRRFRVPFTVRINNKSNFILKDEAPNLSFEYRRGVDGEERTDLTKNDLLPSLSMGEKRAMYLLYILFDIERIKSQSAAGIKHLVVADDVADSFDYKNKYAIIEYLADLSHNPNIDLLVLTHNYDFYRTVRMRLDVKRNHCYIAQKEKTGVVKMSVFLYQNNFFKNVIISGIKGKDSHKKKKMLIASIPFYRNLAEYCGNDSDQLKLTCFLHCKTTPIETENATLADLWAIICKYVNGSTTTFGEEKYCDVVRQLAEEISSDDDDVSLENKLIVSIAARLRAEKYMKALLVSKEGECQDSNKNQTRDWYNRAKPYMGDMEKAVLDEINLITPEAIHLNAFMYEPIIDISIWALNDIYSRTADLLLRND